MNTFPNNNEEEEEEEEEEEQADPSPLQLKPPPIALRLKPFKTIEDLIADVNKFTATQGYTVIKSGNKKNGRGIEQKKNLKCTHGGEYKDNVPPELRKRKRAVCTTGCKWAAYGKLVEGEWFLFLKETKHNHPPSKPEALNPL